MKKHLFLLIAAAPFVCCLFVLGCQKPTADPPTAPPITQPPGQPPSQPPVVPSEPIDSAVSLYIGGYDTLYAFDARNGIMKWRVKLGGAGDAYNYWGSSPAYWNGNVYIGCYDKKLYAFDTTGKFKWSFLTDATITASPVVYKGKVYINSGNGTIYCIDGMTGQQIWQTTGDRTDAGSLVIRDGSIYVSGTYNLMAIDALTGQLIWSFTTNTYTSTRMSPVVVNNKVYVMAGGVGQYGETGLCVINKTTGALIWSKVLDHAVEPVSINIGNGYVYCLSENINGNTGIAAYDTTNGTFKWLTKQDDIAGSLSVSFPVLVDSIAFFPSVNNRFNAYDAFTGFLKWRRGFDDTIDGGTIANKVVYCNERGGIADYGYVLAFDASTGNSIWAAKVWTDFHGIPCVVTKSGKMHRLGDVYN